jgi:hypothetical protein
VGLVFRVGDVGMDFLEDVEVFMEGGGLVFIFVF